MEGETKQDAKKEEKVPAKKAGPAVSVAPKLQGVTDVMKQALIAAYPEAKAIVVVAHGPHEVVAEIDDVPRKAVWKE